VSKQLKKKEEVFQETRKSVEEEKEGWVKEF